MRNGESSTLEFTSLERQQSAGITPQQSNRETQQQLYPNSNASPPPMPSLSRQ